VSLELSEDTILELLYGSRGKRIRENNIASFLE
jgi:hypothetical protein